MEYIDAELLLQNNMKSAYEQNFFHANKPLNRLMARSQIVCLWQIWGNSILIPWSYNILFTFIEADSLAL